MPEKKKFEILGKNKKLELLAVVQQPVAKIFAQFPRRLPSIDGRFRPIPKLYSKNDEFISYSHGTFERLGPRDRERVVRDYSILLKFERTSNTQTKIWGTFPSYKKRIRESFEPCIRILLEGKSGFKFFEIGDELLVFYQVTTIARPPINITQAFPNELRIDPLPNRRFRPLCLIEKVEGNYLAYSPKPPYRAVVFKIHPHGSGIHAVYYYKTQTPNEYLDRQLDSLCRKIVFDVKTKVEQEPTRAVDNPLTILKRRLAEGSISEEEFLRKKKLLE